jgi:hypothetical protein
MEASDPDRPTPVDYYAGLLRVWRDGEGGVWRASLQPVDGREQIGFADLERLFTYILRVLTPSIDATPADDVERAKASAGAQALLQQIIK